MPPELGVGPEAGQSLRQLGETLSDPALYSDGDRARAVTAERKSAEEQVAWLMREWEDLSTSLGALSPTGGEG